MMALNSVCSRHEGLLTSQEKTRWHDRHLRQEDNATYKAVLVWCSRYVMSDCFPMDCSPPGSSLHGILQARLLEWVVGCYSLLQKIITTQGLNQGLQYCRQVLYHLSHQGSHSIQP